MLRVLMNTRILLLLASFLAFQCQGFHLAHYYYGPSSSPHQSISRCSSHCHNNRVISRQSPLLLSHHHRYRYRHSQRIVSSITTTLLAAASADDHDDNDNEPDDINTTPSEEEEDTAAASSSSTAGIDLSLDDRLYRVRLSRFPGIEWGTDLSFCFVYVRAMDPTGAASMSGQVAVGDQLCELRAIMGDDDQDDSPPVVNLLGAPFDYVMTAFATLDKGVQDVELVFFRGTQDDLKAVCTGDGAKQEPDTVTITVIQNKGSPDETTRQITAPAGCNVREVLTNNEINVYQSITRWTNCKGKQLCGTCIVNITDGSLQTNRKSMDEASTLRENPDSYRLSCVTFAYGDITVETFPPIEAAQWTR